MIYNDTDICLKYTTVQVIKETNNSSVSVLKDSRGETVICKKIVSRIYKQIRNDFYKEISSLQRIHGDNIYVSKEDNTTCVIYINDFYMKNENDLNKIYMIMPFYKYTLDVFISAKYNFDIKLLISNICEGVLKMHSNGVIHRDIKPDNIVMDDCNNPTFIDFGISLIIGTELSVSCEYKLQTILYRAPECQFYETSDTYYIDHGYGADIWSLGCVIYFIMTGEDFFGKKNWSQEETCEKNYACFLAEIFGVDEIVKLFPGNRFKEYNCFKNTEKKGIDFFLQKIKNINIYQLLASIFILDETKRPNILTILNDEYFGAPRPTTPYLINIIVKNAFELQKKYIFQKKNMDIIYSQYKYIKTDDMKSIQCCFEMCKEIEEYMGSCDILFFSVALTLAMEINKDALIDRDLVVKNVNLLMKDIKYEKIHIINTEKNIIKILKGNFIKSTPLEFVEYYKNGTNLYFRLVEFLTISSYFNEFNGIYLPSEIAAGSIYLSNKINNIEDYNYTQFGKTDFKSIAREIYGNISATSKSLFSGPHQFLYELVKNFKFT